jgi:hypothetical protein
VACLTNRDTLSDVGVDTTPPAAPSCKTGETVVRWSSVDFTAGAGLTLSNNQFSVNFAGSGTANTVARSDHSHTLGDGEVTTAKLAANAVTGAKIANITRAMPASLVNTHVLMPSAGASLVFYSFVIPPDYAGGDVTIREWWQGHDNPGVARLDRRMNRLPPNTASAVYIATVTHDYTCCDSARTWTLSASSIAAGDLIYIDIVRYGDDSADTMGRLGLLAVGVEYTADQ